MAISGARLQELLQPAVAAQGYDLEAVSVTTAGRRSVVRVVIDRDGGVDLDAVADVSRAISVTLDTSPEVGDAPYVLEVTSPGVDRPLSEPRHWRRNVGRLVQAGEHRGRIVAADDDSVTLDVNGVEQVKGYAELGPGQVQVEFNRPAVST